MKPFVWVTAFVLAILFLSGAGVACVDLLLEGNLINNPKLKPALGLLVTGIMFLGIGLRGWRSHRRSTEARHQPPGSQAPK